MSHHRHAWIITAMLGAILWGMTSHLSGRNEPWDSGAYWSASYPLALLLSGCLGFAFPERTWRWAVLLIFTQLPIMLVGGSGLGLLPLGLILLGFLSLPAIFLAAVGARLRRWAEA